MKCQGCGTDLDPFEEQVNAAVDQVLETSLKDAEKKGGVCPLCGHSKAIPYSHRKTVLFGLLLASLLVGIGVAVGIYRSQQTQRAAVAKEAVSRMSTNPNVARLIGTPITIQPGLQGYVRQDETGWKEVRLTIPVHGPKADAVVRVIGGRGTGPWVFTTFEVDFAKQHKKLDLISGRVVEYDPNAYIEVHTQAAAIPEYTTALAAPPHMDGSFPCVFTTVGQKHEVTPRLGKCAMPTMDGGPVERFETDLRSADFVMRETDLYLNDVFQVPLTRSYTSWDWVHSNPVHAFGRNCNHPYDIAPVGKRNPYTFMMLDLEDGEFLYFDRISKGTGYADAVYQHTETSARFYKATIRWNGNGWTTQLMDGSEILFPESYNARNTAQGAPTEIRDSKGNRLILRRDPARNLQEIRTPHGHWIKFTYDDLSRIKRAEDDAGHWAKYEYNPHGMLVSAMLSSGGERHYEYDRSLMTRITDEHGRVLIQNWYSSGALIRQWFGNGDEYSYRYDWAPHGYYAEDAIITFPDQTNETLLRVGDSVPNFVKNARR